MIPFDTIVIGGSFAGMSAALQLVRARRSVAIIDSGLRRNRFTTRSHGFLGQDGVPPEDIVARAKAQLTSYPTLQWFDGTARSADRTANGFTVAMGPLRLEGTTLILAHGVIDELPAIEGIAPRWGRSVFHCPYCHAFEGAGGPIGVLAVGEASVAHALMLPDWGPVSLFLNGAFTPTATQREALRKRGVKVIEGAVAKVEGDIAVTLANGSTHDLVALFILPRTRPATTLADQLGCTSERGPTGPFLRRNEHMETSVPGVFACGDAARAFGNVAINVGDGTLAGMHVHHWLVTGGHHARSGALAPSTQKAE